MRDFQVGRDAEAPSFLQQLLAKRAMLLNLQEKTGRPMDAALREVDRQIAQCLKHKDIIGGAGVTKSGEEK